MASMLLRATRQLSFLRRATFVPFTALSPKRSFSISPIIQQRVEHNLIPHFHSSGRFYSNNEKRKQEEKTTGLHPVSAVYCLVENVRSVGSMIAWCVIIWGIWKGYSTEDPAKAKALETIINDPGVKELFGENLERRGAIVEERRYVLSHDTLHLRYTIPLKGDHDVGIAQCEHVSNNETKQWRYIRVETTFGLIHYVIDNREQIGPSIFESSS